MTIGDRTVAALRETFEKQYVELAMPRSYDLHYNETTFDRIGGNGIYFFTKPRYMWRGFLMAMIAEAKQRRVPEDIIAAMKKELRS